MSPEKSNLLDEAYQYYLNLALKQGSLKRKNQYLSEDIMGYGSTIDEKVFSLSAFIPMIKRQQQQMSNVEMEFEVIPVVRKISADENTAIYVDEYQLSFTTEKGTIPIFLRNSMILEYREKLWKIVHWHCSKPNETMGEEDILHLKEWQAEKAKLEKLVAEKTVDLAQKNRELEIEAALERVRTRTMAMQNSKELADAASTLFQQLQSLGGNITATGIGLCQKDNPIGEFWMGSTSGLELEAIHIRHDIDPTHQNIFKAWKRQETLYLEERTGKELQQHYQNMMSEPSFKAKIELAQKAGYQIPKRQIWHTANFKYGFLLITTTEPYQQAKILPRFAKVFEQTYTRFLDLQKAEAQTRAAQIEVALESVRSRSLAMHRTEELGDVITVIFERLKKLKFPVDEGVTLVTFKKGSKDLTEWMYNPDFLTAMKSNLPYFDHPVLSDFWEAKNNGKEFLVNRFTTEEKQSFLNYIFNHTDYKHTPEEVKTAFLDAETYSTFFAFQKNTAIFIHDFSGMDLTVNEIDILKRFSRVFEQTYIRFLDIQKAEIQAREAQVETALERVRSRTMAMHQSIELSETASILFHQLEKLGIPLLGCGFTVIAENQKDGKMYFSLGGNINPFGVPMNVNKNAQIKVAYNAWKNKESILVKTISGEALKDHLESMEKQQLALGIKKDKKIKVAYESLYQSPLTKMTTNIVFFSSGWLVFNTIEAIKNKVLLQRFAKVFEQTYTRFLDLHKAETQAREAQIEAALERVRSKTMAMHKSEELSQVATAMFKEFQALNLINEVARIVININDEENGDCEMWTTRIGGEELSANFKYNYLEHELWEKEYRAYQKVAKHKRKEHKYIVVHEGKGFEELMTFGLEKKIVPLEEVKLIKKLGIQKWIEHIVWFAYGSVVIARDSSLSEEGFTILQRFTAVFEQTYTRFLDLQRAEAQAREAQIEAALERVRAASMAMQTSGEIGTVLGKMLEEMTLLDMNLTRAIIWTFHPEKQLTKWWGGHPEVKNIAKSYTIEYHVQKHHPTFKMYLKSWKERKEMFLYKLEGAEKESWDDILFLDSELKTLPEEVIKGMREPKAVYLSNSFNEFGVLMIGSLEPLSESNLAIIKRFSSLFEQTYRRFLDVQEAEERAREAQIEAALERVRARAMAMRHSDELSAAAELLYQEFFKLGVESFSCGYLINDEEKGEWKIWLTNPREPFFKEFWTIPYNADHNLQTRYKSWKNQEEFHCAVLEGEANKAHHLVISKYAPWKEDILEDLTQQLVFNSAHFSLGHLLVISPNRLSSEMEQAMVRFANVFDLTYRRFLDLEKTEEQNRQLEKVFNENQRLLHSILPEQIAEQIRAGQQTIVKRFEQVSILFADIVGFTILSEKLTPQEVVDILNGLFSKFDDLTDKYGLEKIKTIGDAYMVASGVPEERENHALVLFQFAQEMLKAIQIFNKKHKLTLEIRVGINSGPVVAGVIGKKKFSYDLWGDTVNTAARMEANGQASCIQVASPTYELLKNDFAFKKIPDVEIKGKGKMDVYLWKNK